jgi:tRNA(Ile)-lysidine synthase
VVRPLLTFRREEIQAWLRTEGIPWLRDASNLDPRWDRARIRARILPALEAAASVPVRERLRALGRSAARADAALDHHARELLDRALDARGGAWGEEAFRLRRAPLAAAPEETRGRAVRLLARELGVELARGGTRAAVQFISGGDSGTRVDLGEGLQIAREFDRIWLGWPDVPEPDEELSIPGPEPGAGTVTVGGRRWRVRWGSEPGPPEPAHRLPTATSRLPFPLTVRGWRDGDRIHRQGGTRKLKRLFNDRRVPLSRRSRIPVLATAGGRVIWVPGQARDPEILPRDGEDVLLITIHDA